MGFLVSKLCLCGSAFGRFLFCGLLYRWYSQCIFWKCFTECRLDAACSADIPIDLSDLTLHISEIS